MKNTHILSAASIIVITACSNGPKKTTNQTTTGQTTEVTTDTTNNVAQTPKSVDTNFLLVPGKSAGKININTDAKEAYALLGTPDGGDSAMQKSVAIWYKGHDPKSYSTAIYSMRDTTTDNPPLIIQQVRVTSPGFMTEDNIGISSSLEEIKNKYKVSKLDDVQDGDRKRQIYDSTAGISFELDKEGTCTGIIIHKAGEALKGTYLDIR